MNRLLAAIPAGLLTEWQAFFELEPFGTAREDLRAGVVAASVANFAPFRDKGAKSFKPSDFFENLKPPMTPMSGIEMSQQAKALTASMGGRVQTREEGLKRAKAEAEKKAKLAAAKEASRVRAETLAKERADRKAAREAKRKK